MAAAAASLAGPPLTNRVTFAAALPLTERATAALPIAILSLAIVLIAAAGILLAGRSSRAGSGVASAGERGGAPNAVGGAAHGGSAGGAPREGRGGALNAVQRVARNTGVSIGAQLVNKVVDLAFALVVLRALGATGTGQYEYAAMVWLYTKTLSDFGLAVLTTREVAQRRELAGRYLGLTTLLRLALWLAAVPLVGGFTLAGWRWLDLSRPT